MSIKNSTPVAIQLQTEIYQNDEKNEHFFDVKGQLIKMRDVLYIRYQEPATPDNPSAPVTIKIDPDGSVQLIRSGGQRMRLKFTYQKTNYASYRTPYGLIQISTFTNNLRVTLKDRPVSGKVSLDYELYAGEEKLGVYYLRLQFTA